jgi:hypothetical protein
MIGALGRVLAIGFALLALGGLIAAVGVHVGALRGTNVLGDGMSGWIALHAGVFFVVLPIVATLVLEALRKRRRPALTGSRAGIVAVALFVYCLGTLAWAAIGARSGTLVQGTSPAAMLAGARVFSSGWMLFYFVALSFFVARAFPTDPPP